MTISDPFESEGWTLASHRGVRNTRSDRRSALPEIKPGVTAEDQNDPDGFGSDCEMATRLAPSTLESTSFRLLRFTVGLLLTSMGITAILLVGFSLIHVRNFGTDLALPVVGLSVLVGILLLGGGFGLMATSGARIDTVEFNTSFDGRANPILGEVSESKSNPAAGFSAGGITETRKVDVA